MNAKWAQWCGVAAGVWLMVAPAALGYVDTSAADVHRTIGPLVASCATVALWAATRDVRWVNLPLAVILAVAPVVTHHPLPATGVALATSIAVVVTLPLGGPDPQRRGTGWRGVLPG